MSLTLNANPPTLNPLMPFDTVYMRHFFLSLRVGRLTVSMSAEVSEDQREMVASLYSPSLLPVAK